jgi:acyl transferase domain-containing protein
MNVIRDREPGVVAERALVPLAVVGIGCNFPGGVQSADDFWRLLRNGTSAISEVPADRWNIDAFYDADPSAPGKSVTKWGGFVDDIAMFDADFFGISPSEAEAMDPQQRLILQTVWEAFEDAGIAPDRMAGSNAGTFLGVSSSDYASVQRYSRAGLNVYAGTGSALSIISGRVAHRLDLRGPSISVDTACSSALVAANLACEALWRGECGLAIAGGVNALLDPAVYVMFSKANMMSDTGRVRTFDAKADGYVRAEGAGAVILKRLDDAVADGDRVLAVIRAGMVNQDGRTSSLTVPDGGAQQAMLRAACARAGVAPDEVDYVEAHGTGTPVGDPIEADAIGRVFGQGRRDGGKIVVGAVKTNVGHLEPAAGIAGLIKTVLCLKNGEIPANLNFDEPSPNIDIDGLRIALPDKHMHWTPTTGVRRAVVNSFGFGGTNACLLLEEAPPSAKPIGATKVRRPACLVPLSAATPTALPTVAQALADELEAAGPKAPNLRDLVGTLAFRRAHLTHRLGIVATSRPDLIAKLRAFAAGDVGAAKDGAPPSIISGRRGDIGKTAFVFSGQGGQWWRMGRDLLDRDPVFRAEIDRVDAVLRDIADMSVIDELRRTKRLSRVDLTAVTQPVIFAVQVGLAARWRAWGYEPDLVFGHSFGEVAASYVAGAMSMERAALPPSLCRRTMRSAISPKVARKGLPSPPSIRAHWLRWPAKSRPCNGSSNECAQTTVRTSSPAPSMSISRPIVPKWTRSGTSFSTHWWT